MFSLERRKIITNFDQFDYPWDSIRYVLDSGGGLFLPLFFFFFSPVIPLLPLNDCIYYRTTTTTVGNNYRRDIFFILSIDICFRQTENRRYEIRYRIEREWGEGEERENVYTHTHRENRTDRRCSQIAKTGSAKVARPDPIEIFSKNTTTRFIIYFNFFFFLNFVLSSHYLSSRIILL